MKFELKPSLLLASLAWLCFFALAWLLILDRVPADGRRWTFLVVFFIVGLFASAIYRGKEQGARYVSKALDTKANDEILKGMKNGKK